MNALVGLKQASRPKYEMLADVCLGPFASVWPCLGHVRLGRKIGIAAQRCGRRPWPRRRLDQSLGASMRRDGDAWNRAGKRRLAPRPDQAQLISAPEAWFEPSGELPRPVRFF